MVARIEKEGEPLTMSQALSLAIFCVNTMIDPSASDEADLDVLDARSEEVVKMLAPLRDRYATVEARDLS